MIALNPRAVRAFLCLTPLAWLASCAQPADIEAPPSAVTVAGSATNRPAAPRVEPRAETPPSASATADKAGAATTTAPAANAPIEAKTASGAVAGRLGSIGRRTYIFAGRNRKVQLGVMRPGTSVALRSVTPEPGEDCKNGRWYAVQPTGYVCDDLNVTTDLESELYRALAALAPREEGALPFGYGYSTGAPMYGKIPTPEEAKKVERKYRPVEKLRRPEKASGHMELTTTEPPAVTGPVPFFFAAHRQAPLMPWQNDGLVRKSIREGNLLSFQGVVADEAGRKFLLATNLTAVPADRVWVFKPSEFHGVELGGEVKAPLGWTRRKARPRYARKGERFVEDGEWGPRTAVLLTGQRVESDGQTYHEARDGKGWARGDHLSMVERLTELPKGVDPGDQWIDVSLSQGTLTLLKGMEPIYSTLMSPGAGGTTQSAALSIDELLSGAFTPLGLYRMSYKYRAAVMTPEDGPEPEKTWIDDVPYTMYFRPPYAIHTTYWHEDLGHPKSGGCVNVSPLDARYLFEHSEPRVPDGWYGASNNLPEQPGTKIHLRK